MCPSPLRSPTCIKPVNRMFRRYGCGNRRPCQRLARVLAQRKAEPGSLRDYHVGPEDVLEIGVLALEEPDKVSKVQLAVQSDGAINIPWIGLVQVGRLDVARERSPDQGFD